ncbi:MAG: Trm112 family protein [Verrucomicrobiales bacterium]
MKLPLTPQALAIQRCPKTKQALHVATDEESTTWKTLDEDAEGFLVTKDGAIAYPIDDGYPILLLERALTRPE